MAVPCYCAGRQQEGPLTHLSPADQVGDPDWSSPNWPNPNYWAYLRSQLTKITCVVQSFLKKWNARYKFLDYKYAKNIKEKSKTKVKLSNKHLFIFYIPLSKLFFKLFYIKNNICNVLTDHWIFLNEVTKANGFCSYATT